MLTVPNELWMALRAYQAVAAQEPDAEAHRVFTIVAKKVEEIIAAKLSGDDDMAERLDRAKSRIISDAFVMQPPEFGPMNRQLHTFVKARLATSVRIEAAQ